MNAHLIINTEYFFPEFALSHFQGSGGNLFTENVVYTFSVAKCSPPVRDAVSTLEFFYFPSAKRNWISLEMDSAANWVPYVLDILSKDFLELRNVPENIRKLYEKDYSTRIRPWIDRQIERIESESDPSYEFTTNLPDLSF